MDEIIQMLEEIHLPFAYDHFAEGEAAEPPFICYLLPGSGDTTDKAAYDDWYKNVYVSPAPASEEGV